MFIYLNLCPCPGPWMVWYKSWSIFYSDLFQTKNLDEIILTLNRLMQSKSNEKEKIRQQKLLERIAVLFSLMYDGLHYHLPGQAHNNVSVNAQKPKEFNSDGKWKLS